MSEKTAKVHTQVSNRAKHQQNVNKKVVFKPVLDNPLRIHWPSVPVNLQNLVLAQLVSLLNGISQHHRIHRKRKREPESESKNKKPKLQDLPSENHAAHQNVSMSAASPHDDIQGFPVNISPASDTPLDVPQILRHLTIGINSVTKKLESQIKRHHISSSHSPVPPSPRFIKLVLVCRADVDPPILIDHLPHLVAACNSSKPKEPVILAPLPKGAEFTLADALGVRRAAVLALDIDTPDLTSLTSLLDTVPILSAAWLTVPAPTVKQPPSFIQTHIKQMRTTAPKDMKAAKQQRADNRAEAKERKKKRQKDK